MVRNNVMVKTIAVWVCLGFALELSAAIFDFDLQGQAGAGLLPGNNVPPNSTGASGSANGPIRYDDSNNQLTFDISFSNLSDVLVAAEIRGPADFSSNANVLYDLAPYTSGSGNTSGQFLSDPNGQGGVLTLIPNPSGSTYSIAEQENQLKSGLWYIEVHSSGTYSMGEIRGNLVAVPEPAQYATYTALALGGLMICRRLKRRASAQCH